MAPKQKKGPLDGCTVVLSGTFPGHSHAQLSTSVKDLGGTFSTKVADDCTHLVTSEKDFQAGSAKAYLSLCGSYCLSPFVDAAEADLASLVKRAAELSQISVVGIDWLLETMDEKRKAEEKIYLMAKSDPAALPGKSDAGKKRKRDDPVKSEEPESDKEAKKSLKKQKDDPVKNEEDVVARNEEDGPINKQEDGPDNKQNDGQKAGSRATRVPVDEMCNPYGSFHVYIAKDGTIFDASLNQTNAGNNNNKFYRIQILQSVSKGDYRTWTRWGRVGENGQTAWLGNGSLDDAISQFEKKFKDKSGHKWDNRLDPPKKGKYTFIERNYEEDSDHSDDDTAAHRRGSKASDKTEMKAVSSTLAKPVQDLMELIFNQQYFAATMSSMSYDANKLPLGKLSKRTLKSGFEALKQLAELLANPSRAPEVHNMPYGEALPELSNSYYTYIPHSFGRNRPPIINNDDMLKREVELLESLSDMSIAEEIMKTAKEDVTSTVHPIDRQYAGLDMAEMTPLEHKSQEFKELENYLLKTHGATHGMKFKVEAIFRIERNGEFDRFSKSPYAKLKGDRRLLWHGSRCTNFGGILSQGLRIAPPEAPVNGYMFGKGVYLADISSKSAGYCCHYSSGGIGLLLLCEAELGKPMLELTNASYNAAEEAKKKGCYATWGKGRTGPQAWKDASCVNEKLKGVLIPDISQPPGPTSVDGASLYYNEYICYDVAQIRLRYLFRVKMT